MSSTETYVLVTDGIIEMNCIANSYTEAANLFLEYLKNKNNDSIYEFHKSGEIHEYNGSELKTIYEYNGHDLKTVHFIFTKHYIDVLRRIFNKHYIDVLRRYK